jgi:outer membrane protein TolC
MTFLSRCLKTRVIILYISVLFLNSANFATIVFAQDSSSSSSTPTLRGLDKDVQEREKFDDLTQKSLSESSAIFVDPEQVIVKPPLLTSLIRLDRRLSPLQLDANLVQEVNLKDILQTALLNNLAIKISASNMAISKWNYITSLGSFLPDLINGISYQGIKGHYASPAGASLPVNSPFFTATAGFNYNLFTGGKNLYTALQNKHQYKASQYALKGMTNDVLMEATRLYYQLVLNDVLLQIRVKGTEVAQGVVIENQDLYDNGVNTMLEVLQAKYQLSKERQELIAQEAERRQSAVHLAEALNQDGNTDLMIKDRTVKKIRLVDDNLMAADLLQISIDNRPELKKYGELRIAAKDAVKVARASLFPTVAAQGNVIGTGANVARGSTSTTPLSSSGIGIGGISSAGGLPLAGGSGGFTRWAERGLFTLGVNVQWNLGGMALTEIAQIQAARNNARRVDLEFHKVLIDIYREVRDTYLESLKAENLIVETTDAVKFAEEGLDIAKIRLAEGVGINIDVINAERDYIAALIAKAKAIIQYNLTQARLLYVMGRNNVDTLTSVVPMKK